MVIGYLMGITDKRYFSLNIFPPVCKGSNGLGEIFLSFLTEVEIQNYFEFCSTCDLYLDSITW